MTRFLNFLVDKKFPIKYPIAGCAYLNIIAYFLGTGVGFFIASQFTKDNLNKLIDHLVDEGFLRSARITLVSLIIMSYVGQIFLIMAHRSS